MHGTSSEYFDLFLFRCAKICILRRIPFEERVIEINSIAVFLNRDATERSWGAASYHISMDIKPILTPRGAAEF